MKYIITGRNIEVTEGLKSAIYEKIGKLERYFTPDATVYVTLSVQKDRQKIEVTIPVKGSLVRAEQESSDMYVSIDLVEEIIERQLRRYKTKLIAREQDGGDCRMPRPRRLFRKPDARRKAPLPRLRLLCISVGWRCRPGYAVPLCSPPARP